MADEKIVTNVVATSDFSSLIADVQRTTSALSKLQAELSLSNKALAAQAGQIQKSFGDTLRSTGQFTTHFVTVGSEVETFGKKLDAGKLKLGDYFRTWQAHTKTSGGLIRDLAKQQVALQNAIVQPLGKAADGMMKFNVHVANGIDETVNKTALARKELQIYNKVIQDGGVQLINWGKNTQWAGRQLTVGLTVPLAAFGAASAKAFREADQELVRLQKVYGGLAATSSQELAKVRQDVSNTARELASMYGASFKDTIALAADIAATGKQGEELLKSTREATRLSILGEVDRQEAMKATLAIQSAFKQNTEELTESINFLNAVENQTSTSLADLVEAIPKAGPVVKALGGDVQDLALYLTAMREGGVNASEGANALKSALASIINPTKVAKEQFMSFGIDLEGIVNKNAGNLTQTILSIQSALDALDPLKKSQAIEQLFGKFQFARMNALFENLGKQGSQTLQVLDLMKASSQDLANVAGRELSQITESASGQYKRAIESLKADLAGLGEQFLKIGTFFIKVIDGVVKFVTKLPDPIKNFLGLLGGITALAGPLIMLTGVFANFIGYVIKGIGHIRALGRGGEGFKLLTPQILAAEQAGSLIEKTFYSDAQAAKILSAALANLSNEYTILQQKANAGAVSAQPIISTVAGNVVMEGSGRVADPTSPYIGKPYSRQMSHTRPVAGMTSEEKSAQNIFGVVPGPAPVNQRIGKRPQMYMVDDLPRVEGLTEVNAVSTGIVAEEAAKWHAMTAALAMQSKDEIKALVTEVKATGAITTELSTAYQALLPEMSKITTLAAQESALIVADLQASKITVTQARRKVIELNRQIEAMMAEAATGVATAQGRTINLTTVPLTGQPVVDPVTGKSNMKEMFHKSRTAALVDKIARNLGVRTSGGGYSMETTKPRRLNDGGNVFYNNGDQVPGPNVNADVVPAMLTPGEFVIRRDVAQQDPDGMRALNAGEAVVVPVNRNLGGVIPVLRALAVRRKGLSGLRTGLRSSGAPGRSARNVNSPQSFSFEAYSRNRIPGAGLSFLTDSGAITPEEAAILRGMVGAHGSGRDFQRATGLRSRSGAYPTTRVGDIPDLFPELSGSYTPTGRSRASFQKESNLQAQLLPGSMVHAPGGFNTALGSGATRDALGTVQGFQMTNLMDFLISRGVSGANARIIADAAARRLNKILPKKNISEDTWAKSIEAAEQGAIIEHQALLSSIKLSAGGKVPGYILGGRIAKSLRGRSVPQLSPEVIERLTAKWPKKKDFYPQGYQYMLGENDPLHGPLQIGRSQNLKSFAGYDPTEYPRESILYQDPRFSRMNILSAFLTGDEKRRGMQATARYMAGDLDIMSQMERLGNHPLGPIAAMRAVQQKFTGKLYRGLLIGKTQNALPKHIEKAILKAKETGDWGSLLGKEFIMRRSSWSKNKMIADYFAMRGSDPGSVLLEAIVRNRNIVPAGDLFPRRAYRAPYGQDYPMGKFGGGIERKEEEAIFGGKFRIVGYKNGKLQIETMAEARAMGGPVNAGQPYLVGEKGPELFVPRNNGGIIPNYRIGGQVGRYGRLRNAIRGDQPVGRQRFDEEGNPLPVDPNSMMVSSMAGMAMMMGGQAMPGMAGQAMTFAGLSMQMAPMLKMMKPLISGMGTFAGVGLKIKTIWTATFTALRAGLAALMGPVGLLSIGIGAAVTAFLKMKDNATKAGEVNRAMFGLTSTALEEVGIKYKTVSERLKEVNEQLELNKARVKSSYEEYTKSGVSGLDLTLKQLKEGVANAKKEDKESVGLFDKAKTTQVNQLAASMKAQYVALGMSVQEATNQIYILIKASNKSSQAVDAISSDAFKSINDQASAATYTVKLLTNVLSNKGAFNAEEFSRGLDNMLTSLDAYKNSLTKTTKDSVGLTESQALKKTFDEIAKVKGNTLKIEGAALDALKQQNLVLGSMLGKAETLASVFAKYQLVSAGLSDQIDIQALSPEDAVSVAKGYEVTKQAAGEVLSKTKLGQITSATEKAAKNALDLANKASKMDSSAIDASIKNKQKLIAKLEEERNARLKILDLQEKSASFETTIQQAQIRYQEALAAGNMAQAAQEQLNIKQLSGDRQRELARQSINDKADAERKKLESEIERLQAQKDAQAKAVVAAQNNAESLAAKSAQRSGFKSELENLIATFGGGNRTEIRGDAMKLQEFLGRMRKSGMGTEVSDLFSRNNILEKAKGKDTLQPFVDLLTKLKTSTDKELTNPKYDKFDSAVKLFAEAVANFVAISGIDSKKLPFPFERPKSEQGSAQTNRKNESWRDPVVKRWGGGIAKKGILHSFGEQGKEYGIPSTDMMILNNFQSKNLDAKFKLPNMAYSVNGQQKMFGGQDSYTVNNYITGTDLDVEQLSEAITRKTIATIKDMKYNNKVTNGSPGARLI